MIPNIIIPAIVILTVMVSIGFAIDLMLAGKKRQGSSYGFRADDDTLALAPHLVSAPLVQRRRFESQASYQMRLNWKKIEEIDKTLDRIDENQEEIEHMLSEMKRMRSEMFPAS